MKRRSKAAQNEATAKNYMTHISNVQMKGIISESIKAVLNESGYDEFDGYDDDLEYDKVFDDAYHYIMANNPKVMSWRGIADALGYRLETIGQNDMETLKDAIQDAMAEAE